MKEDCCCQWHITLEVKYMNYLLAIVGQYAALEKGDFLLVVFWKLCNIVHNYGALIWNRIFTHLTHRFLARTRISFVKHRNGCGLDGCLSVTLSVNFNKTDLRPCGFYYVHSSPRTLLSVQQTLLENLARVLRSGRETRGGWKKLLHIRNFLLPFPCFAPRCAEVDIWYKDYLGFAV